MRSSTEALDEEISMPRELLAEIEAQPGDWAALLKEVAGTMFVDYRRGMFAEAG